MDQYLNDKGLHARIDKLELAIEELVAKVKDLERNTTKFSVLGASPFPIPLKDDYDPYSKKFKITC